MLEDAGIAEGRAPAVATTAMVSSPSAWATLAGVEVLRDGGSAVDAAVAVGAALVVAQPHQCGLGGDAFWLVRGCTGPTSALNATGRTAAAVDAAALRERGLTALPERSGLAVTVPGVVDGWAQAHGRHGRLGLDRLLAPAIAGAADGLPVTPLFARQLRISEPVLRAREESARVFLPGGRPPRAGERFAQPDLARTLTALAREPDALYRGELAERVAAAARAADGWLSADDLAAHASEWTDPLRGPVAGWTVEEMPPNSQGVAALVALRLLDDAGALDDAHRGVEAAKVLMAVRDREVGDPRAMARPGHELLEEAYLGALRPLLADEGVLRRSAIEAVLPGSAEAAAHVAHAGDTVHFAVVDGDGLAVSCIQSVFSDFGSGIVVPGTGVVLHNRGSGMRLQPGHPDSLAPGKRPMHTLAPGMATTAGRTAAVFGSMGGHAQAQLHVQLVGAMAGAGLDPATAIARPRWYVAPQDDDEPVVQVESRGPLAGALAARGHRVLEVEPYDSTMGHAQAIVVDEGPGVLVGSADPRSDGLALGF